MGLIRRLVVPTERVVSEVDVDTQVVQGFPEVGDLLALTYELVETRAQRVRFPCVNLAAFMYQAPQ